MPVPDVKIIITGIDKFSRTIGKSLKGLDSIGRKTSQIGKHLTRNVTLPIVAIGVAAAISSVNINKAMADVGTLIPGNLRKLHALKKEVQALAIVTGKSQIDIAQGLYQIISAFGDSAISMEKLTVNARAAVAAGLGTTTLDAINLTAAATKAFGDVSVAATQKVADLAFETVRLGQTTFPELAANMGKVAPLAAVLGVTLEEMFGVMATATGVTGDTARVATQLQGIFGALLKPTMDMEVAFKKLGVSSGQELIKMYGLQKAIKVLHELAVKYEKPLGKLVGRKEALSLVFALNGKLADVFSKKLGEMTDVVGAAEVAFKEQTEGINKAGFAFSQFMSKVGILASKIGDKLVPKLQILGEKYLLPLINKMLNATEAQIEMGIAIGAIAAIIPPLLIGLGFLISAISKIGIVIMKVWPLLLTVGKWLFVANPLVALIAAAILIWAHNIYQVYKNWEGFVFLFSFWWKKIKIGFKDIGQSIVNFMQPALDIFVKLAEGVKGIGKLLGFGKSVHHTLETKIGGAGGTENERLEMMTRRVVEVQGSENTFKGTLKIVDAPPRSEVEVEEGELIIETDTGLQLAGVAR